MEFTVIDTPIGPLLAAADEAGLRRLQFPRAAEADGFRAGSGPVAVAPEPGWTEDPAPFEALRTQLAAYFDGRLRRFDLRLAPEGSAFQRRAWAAMSEIPFAGTLSYGALAARLGRPGGARAVGIAAGRNPLPLIVPCHRVIGADGALTGFGGGLALKRRLLSLERRAAGHVAAQLSLFPEDQA